MRLSCGVRSCHFSRQSTSHVVCNARFSAYRGQGASQRSDGKILSMLTTRSENLQRAAMPERTWAVLIYWIGVSRSDLSDEALGHFDRVFGYRCPQQSYTILDTAFNRPSTDVKRPDRTLLFFSRGKTCEEAFPVSDSRDSRDSKGSISCFYRSGIATSLKGILFLSFREYLW